MAFVERFKQESMSVDRQKSSHCREVAVVERWPLVDVRLYSTICLAAPTFLLNLHAGRVSLRSCVAQRGSCSGTRCEHSVKMLPHLVPEHGTRVWHSLGANVNTPIKYPPQNSGKVPVFRSRKPT